MKGGTVGTYDNEKQEPVCQVIGVATADGSPTTPDQARDTRRFDYLAPVLEAVTDRLDAAQASRLRSALALVFGAEAVVVTRDVCQLEPDAATAVMRWAAATLLQGALDQAGGASSSSG